MTIDKELYELIKKQPDKDIVDNIQHIDNLILKLLDARREELRKENPGINLVGVKVSTRIDAAIGGLNHLAINFHERIKELEKNKCKNCCVKHKKEE